jgi:hypothetical protein
MEGRLVRMRCMKSLRLDTEGTFTRYCKIVVTLGQKLNCVTLVAE